MDVTEKLASRLRQLRTERGLSLDALAARSKVSRSNISLIERGQSSPTAVVLDKLAAAFGIPLPVLFEDSPQAAAPAPLLRAAEQAVWTDPASGYVRRQLSPPLPSPLQLVEVHFPPGQRVAYEVGSRDSQFYQQIWMLEGAMEMTVGAHCWQLASGDCLAMRLDAPITYDNPHAQPARYLVALASLSLSR